MDELTRVRSVLPTTGLAGLAQEQRRAPESAAAASSSEASATNTPTGDNAGRPAVVPEANAIPSVSSSPDEVSKEESASEEQLEVRKEDAVSDPIPEASPPTGA
ncbi:hypothetical protein A0H81_13976 [Grifola frondosa]|uniref:Uncharacterized protein n=1 Tax=Grifola frondosa TaxID=5627 RepID=A0A1C7LMU0_GRIFR|nr:hypothetical protein A0H81_13976 [Grifola frondosa]